MAPTVVQAIARALAEARFAVVDDFLPEADLANLEAVATRLYNDGCMYRGNLDQGGSYFGDGMRDEFLNSANVPLKWEAWGNHKAFCRDRDPQAPGIAALPAATDALVSRLKGIIPCTQVPASVCQRLQSADFRESVMVAAYSGANRGRYLRHTDVGRNSVLTALYYVNRGWLPGDGGQLRLYSPGHCSTQAVYDIAPVANRLVLFWADADCPHEVLHTRRDRYAMTVWYVNGKDVLAGPSGFAHLMRNLHAVAPLTVGAALQHLGLSGKAAGKVERLHGACAETRPGDGEPLMVRLQRFGLCAHCGDLSAGGRLGEGHACTRWFCNACWQSGAGRGDSTHVGG